MKKEVHIQTGIEESWKRLYVLRDLTRKTGVLHPFQEVQLKHYPFVFLNPTDSTCEVNVETMAVIYKIIKLKGRKPANLKDRYAHLVKATQQLLGEEYTVLIYLDGKKACSGRPNIDTIPSFLK